ncbi:MULTISPECIES: site-2 protease family protein [Streptococcus]|jgi:lipoprotein|uniref:site-2 protease family protein n=1 Tax=Streptococcus TaxID=1301 RepID=UPI0008A1BD34|nr:MULTISPECIES: site-2 protease family protein [Streptococcus]ATF56218.1 peptidase M50 [Streptococcus oralis]MBR8666862.1 site-2 protease family protein [Streptococcus oralis]MBS9406512.1 site-2 protease family protein [Streptococcus oralis]MCY7107965.1 M50 family metallopeptidase [Streptococcus oralis]MDB6218131.1 site-2 protease family protein [Streptococcus oralis]
MKKIGLSFISGLSFVFLMLGFVFGTIAFKELDFSLVFIPGYLFTFLSIYLIFILHELGHAFCGYLTGYRLVAFGLGNFLLTKKSGKFHLSRTAVLKNVGAQYIGLKEDESDQRIILMLAGGLMVHLGLILLALLYGILTANWYFAATWICLNLSFLLINAKPVGITDGAKIWELLQHPENTKYAYLVLRHSAQTLLAPQEYDLKDFIMPVDENARGSFAESVLIFQGLVFIFDNQIEAAKKHFQSLLDKTDNPMSQTLSQLYLLHIALLEGDHEKAEQYACNRGVKAFLSLKMTDTQIIQACYQFLVKKDMDQTDKAIKIARKNMRTSRLVRDEKRYYENWLAELEEELAEGV